MSKPPVKCTPPTLVVDNPARACARCQNWAPGKAPYGSCRASLPIAYHGGDRMIGEAVWPITMAQDWCAFWEAKTP